jgi:hypothetical protein
MKRAASSDVDTDTLAQRHSSPQPASSLYSLRAPVSSPQRKCKAQSQAVEASGKPSPNDEHNLAAIEAGEIEVEDHLGIFSTKLHQFMRHTLTSQSMPHLPIAEWVDLYRRNEHPEGRHFVIHQHDHPVAGPHYDLRLQFSKTSSVSWSIMYGLPGDPNSQRLNRNATETRIHCLWVRHHPLWMNLLRGLISSPEPSHRDCIREDGKYDYLGYRRVRSPAILCG